MSTCGGWDARVLLLRGRAARKSWSSSEECSGYRTECRSFLGWGSLLTNLQEVISQIAQPFHLGSLFWNWGIKFSRWKYLISQGQLETFFSFLPNLKDAGSVQPPDTLNGSCPTPYFHFAFGRDKREVDRSLVKARKHQAGIVVGLSHVVPCGQSWYGRHHWWRVRWLISKKEGSGWGHVSLYDPHSWTALYLFIYFLAMPQSKWGLGSPTRNQIHALCIGSTKS